MRVKTQEGNRVQWEKVLVVDGNKPQSLPEATLKE